MDQRNRRQMSSGVTNLMLACQQGRDADVKMILSQKPFLASNRDRYGKTAVHYCAENSSLSCAYQVLSIEKSLVNAQDNDGYSPLHLAVISGNKVMARFLLRMGADVDAVDNEKHTCVHWATVCADVESLEILIDAGAKISTSDIHGAHPMHYVAQMSGRYNPNRRAALGVLRLLLQHGAQVDCRDQEGRQPLLWAACSGSSDAILSIISAGGSIDAKDNDGLSALHYAASRGHTDCVDVLITLCGANIDETDNSGCTALYYSVAMGQADCTQLLLKYGSDADHRDLKGRTPAHCGAAKGHLEMLKILENHGANLWIRNLKGDLPLHEAVHFGRKDLVCWLLDQRNNAVNAPNIHGKTPLHIVATNNNIELCQLLIDRGASLNALMKTSKSVLMTPLDAAISRRYRRCAKYLQSQGALPANKLLEKCEMSRSLVNLLESCARPSSSEGTTSPIANSEGGESLPSPSHQPARDRCEHLDSGVHVRLSQVDIWDLWESLTQSSQRLPTTQKEEDDQRDDNSNQLIINNIYVYKEEEKTRSTPENAKVSEESHRKNNRLPTVMEMNRESNGTSNFEYRNGSSISCDRERNIEENHLERADNAKIRRKSRSDVEGADHESERKMKKSLSISDFDRHSDNLIQNRNVRNEKSSLYAKKQLHEDDSYKNAPRTTRRKKNNIEDRETSTDDDLYKRKHHENRTFDKTYHQKNIRREEYNNSIHLDSRTEECGEDKTIKKDKTSRSDGEFDKNANYSNQKDFPEKEKWRRDRKKILEVSSDHLQNIENENYHKGKTYERYNSREDNAVDLTIRADKTKYTKKIPENSKKNIKYDSFTSSSESSETLPAIRHATRSRETTKIEKQSLNKIQDPGSSTEIILPEIHAQKTNNRSSTRQNAPLYTRTVVSEESRKFPEDKDDDLSSFASESISISLSDSSEEISKFNLIPERQKSKRKKHHHSSSGRESSSSSSNEQRKRTSFKSNLKRASALSDITCKHENLLNKEEENIKRTTKSSNSRPRTVIMKWKKATKKVIYYLKKRRKEEEILKNESLQDGIFKGKPKQQSTEEYCRQNNKNLEQERYLRQKHHSEIEERVHPSIKIRDSKLISSPLATSEEKKDEQTKDSDERNSSLSIIKKSSASLELSPEILEKNPPADRPTKQNQSIYKNSSEINDWHTNECKNLIENAEKYLDSSENLSENEGKSVPVLPTIEENVKRKDDETLKVKQEVQLPIITLSSVETTDVQIANVENSEGVSSRPLEDSLERDNLQNFEENTVEITEVAYVDKGVQIDQEVEENYASNTNSLKETIELSTMELKEKISNISSTLSDEIFTTKEELSKIIDDSSAKLEEETKKSVDKLRDLILTMKTEKKPMERKEMTRITEEDEDNTIKNANKEEDFEKVRSETEVVHLEVVESNKDQSLSKNQMGDVMDEVREKSTEDSSNEFSIKESHKDDKYDDSVLPEEVDGDEEDNTFEKNKSESIDSAEESKQLIEETSDGKLLETHQEIRIDEEEIDDTDELILHNKSETGETVYLHSKIDNDVAKDDGSSFSRDEERNLKKKEHFQIVDEECKHGIDENISELLSERRNIKDEAEKTQVEGSENNVENGKVEEKEISDYSKLYLENKIESDYSKIESECLENEFKTKMDDIRSDDKKHFEEELSQSRMNEHAHTTEMMDEGLSSDRSAKKEEIPPHDPSNDTLEEVKEVEENRREQTKCSSEKQDLKDSQENETLDEESVQIRDIKCPEIEDEAMDSQKVIDRESPASASDQNQQLREKTLMAMVVEEFNKLITRDDFAEEEKEEKILESNCQDLKNEHEIKERDESPLKIDKDDALVDDPSREESKLEKVTTVEDDKHVNDTQTLSVTSLDKEIIVKDVKSETQFKSTSDIKINEENNEVRSEGVETNEENAKSVGEKEETEERLIVGQSVLEQIQDKSSENALDDKECQDLNTGMNQEDNVPESISNDEECQHLNSEEKIEEAKEVKGNSEMVSETQNLNTVIIEEIQEKETMGKITKHVCEEEERSESDNVEITKDLQEKNTIIDNELQSERKINDEVVEENITDKDNEVKCASDDEEGKIIKHTNEKIEDVDHNDKIEAEVDEKFTDGDEKAKAEVDENVSEVDEKAESDKKLADEKVEDDDKKVAEESEKIEAEAEAKVKEDEKVEAEAEAKVEDEKVEAEAEAEAKVAEDEKVESEAEEKVEDEKVEAEAEAEAKVAEDEKVEVESEKNISDKDEERKGQEKYNEQELENSEIESVEDGNNIKSSNEKESIINYDKSSEIGSVLDSIDTEIKLEKEKSDEESKSDNEITVISESNDDKSVKTTENHKKSKEISLILETEDIKNEINEETNEKCKEMNSKIDKESNQEKEADGKTEVCNEDLSTIEAEKDEEDPIQQLKSEDVMEDDSLQGSSDKVSSNLSEKIVPDENNQKEKTEVDEKLAKEDEKVEAETDEKVEDEAETDEKLEDEAGEKVEDEADEKVEAETDEKVEVLDKKEESIKIDDNDNILNKTQDKLEFMEEKYIHEVTEEPVEGSEYSEKTMAHLDAESMKFVDVGESMAKVHESEKINVKEKGTEIIQTSTSEELGEISSQVVEKRNFTKLEKKVKDKRINLGLRNHPLQTRKGREVAIDRNRICSKVKRGQPKIEEITVKKGAPDGATYPRKVDTDDHVIYVENTTKNNKVIKPKRGGALQSRNQCTEKAAYSSDDGTNRTGSKVDKRQKTNLVMLRHDEQSLDNDGIQKTPEEHSKKPEDEERKKQDAMEEEEKKSREDSAINEDIETEDTKSINIMEVKETKIVETEVAEHKETKEVTKIKEETKVEEIKEIKIKVEEPLEPPKAPINQRASPRRVKPMTKEDSALKKFRQCYAKHKNSLKNVLPETPTRKTGYTGSYKEVGTTDTVSSRRISDKGRAKKSVPIIKEETSLIDHQEYVTEDAEDEIVSYMSLEKERNKMLRHRFKDSSSVRMPCKKHKTVTIRTTREERSSLGKKIGGSKTRNVAIQASGRPSTRHRVCLDGGKYPVIQCVSCKSNEQSTSQVGREKRICVCEDEEKKCCLKKDLLLSDKMTSRNFSHHRHVSRKLATIPESSVGDALRPCARTRPILPSLPTPNVPPRYSRHDRRVNSILDQIQSLTSPVSFLVTLEGSSTATQHRLSINITPTKSKSMDDIMDRSRNPPVAPRMKKGVSLPNFQSVKHTSQKITSEKIQKRELPRLSTQMARDSSRETKFKRSPGKKRSLKVETNRNATFADVQKPATSKMKGESEPVTFHVDHGRCRDTFKLPTDPLKDKRKWEVTFTIKKDLKNKEAEK
ncbi:titin homolog [Centruroides sculpturatus]|uniref:titin homolog n=1 Tax=Centruroides sculpturatus TaxID=218467 RepID=UPI000C6CD11B|nr:titin homolog [Centruroides sculpturatus]